MKESIQMKEVYAISEGMQSTDTEGKHRWTKIGVGFVNRDNSINVILDAMPFNGKLHIRDRQPRRERPMAAAANR